MLGPDNGRKTRLGTSSHLAAELLMSMANFRMVHVPHRYGVPAIQALMAGDVAVGFAEVVIERADQTRRDHYWR